MPPVEPPDPDSGSAPDVRGPSWSEVRALLEGALDAGSANGPSYIHDHASSGAAAREALRLLEKEAVSGEALAFEGPLFGTDSPGPGTAERLGPWELRRRIGRGGMADVWLAVRADGTYRRRVAIKKLHPALATQEVVARFERERQILANLTHPGIAKMLESGVGPDDAPYIAMELVEGQPIDDFARERRLGIRARVQLMVQVADAVMAAHRMHIVHRDIKPTNVLVDLDGRPTLLDFGVAAVLDPEKNAGTMVTRETNRFLTPNYASPEQMRGEPLRAASDVYSLGALTYELLTGLPPLDVAGRGTAEALELTRDRAPLPPARRLAESPDAALFAQERGLQGARKLKGALGDKSLEAILLAALRKEPARRPPDAGAFRDELSRWLQGRAVQSRRDSWARGLSRVLGRHKLAAALVAALCVTSAASGWRVWEDARTLRAANAELNAQSSLAQGRLDDVRASLAFLLQGTVESLAGIPGTRHAVDRLLSAGIQIAERQDDPELKLQLAVALVRRAARESTQTGPSAGTEQEQQRGLELAEAASRSLAMTGGATEAQLATLVQTRLQVALELLANDSLESSTELVEEAATELSSIRPETPLEEADFANLAAVLWKRRSALELAKGQYRRAATSADEGLQVIESARRDNPALKPLETIASGAPQGPVARENGGIPEGHRDAGPELLFARHALSAAEADLMRFRAVAARALRAPSTGAGEVLTAVNRVRAEHGTNLAIVAGSSNIMLSAAEALFHSGQEAEGRAAIQDVAAALGVDSPLGEGLSFTQLESRALYRCSAARMLLRTAESAGAGDRPRTDEVARALRRMDERMNELAARLETAASPSRTRNALVADLLYGSARIQAFLGNPLESISRLHRAYFLYNKNVEESPKSYHNAVGRCQAAARLAGLMSSGPMEARLWRQRAEEHFKTIPGDEAARDHLSWLERMIRGG